MSHSYVNYTSVSFFDTEILKKFAEGSGQNFVDEDFEENSRSKKLKTAMMDTADDEQVMCINFFLLRP